MRAIKTYTDEIKASQDRFSTLVLSQGIFTTAGRTETPEGIDRKMALHYYGRQFLIREILPSLTDDAKVLIILDSTGGSPDELNWEDLDLKTTFSLANAATHCVSMTDAMIQNYATGQKAEGKSRYFIHALPGVVSTNILQGAPWYIRIPTNGLFAVLGVSPDTCAEYMLKGVDEAAKIKDKNYAFVSRKGKIFEKPAWSEEQVRKVRDHTWEIVDGALAKA